MPPKNVQSNAVNLKDKIDLKRLPRHIAIIMDGNGRWAQQHGAERIFGHQHGVRPVRECAEAAAELGIEYLTLYAFSTENWSRPKEEVDALMELLVNTIHSEIKTLNENNIRLLAIGNLNSLPKKCGIELQDAMQKTASNTRLNLVLALSYSSRWEITHAVQQLVKKAQQGQLSPGQVNEELIHAHLCTAGMPDPELMIRSSGEQRISNFLLWQLAYAELHFTKVLWPDFSKNDLYTAILDYQTRERRFGMTGAQILDRAK